MLQLQAIHKCASTHGGARFTRHGPRRHNKRHDTKHPRHDLRHDPRHDPRHGPMHGPMHGPRRARHDPRRDPKRGPRHGPRHDPTHARAGRIRCIRCIRCIRGTIRGTVRGGTRRCRHARRCCGCGCGCCPLSPLSARQSDSMHVSMSASRAWATGVHGFRRRTPLKSVSSGLPGPPACGADRSWRSRPHAGGWADLLAYCSSGSHQLDRRAGREAARAGAPGNTGKAGVGMARGQGAGRLPVPEVRQGRRHDRTPCLTARLKAEGEDPWSAHNGLSHRTAPLK